VLDFMSEVLETSRRFRVFNVEDQLTREGLGVEVDTSLPGKRVVRALDAIVADRGRPEMIVSTPSSSGPRRTASSGKPQQNGFMESFNGKLRDECLNEHVFSSLAEARRIIDAWRIDYNTVRPHSSLGHLTPKEFAASWRAAHPQQEPDPVPRPATGRVAAVHGASAPRPVAGTPTAGQTENRLNL
jgi:putative transposase